MIKAAFVGNTIHQIINEGCVLYYDNQTWRYLLC